MTNYYSDGTDVGSILDMSLTDKEKVLGRYPDAKSKKQIREVKKTFVSPQPYWEKEGFLITAGPFEIWDENPKKGWARIVNLIKQSDNEKKRQAKVKEMLSDFNAFDAKWHFSNLSIFQVSERQKIQLKGMIFDFLKKNVDTTKEIR
jgi:hypothetical protein|tara:strand:- start:493 stop:933 length:441 start_codon:yes stop_codon:yes gene_type:complete